MIAAFLVIAIFLTRSKKESSGNWIQFFARGKEAGFTIKDMEQLRRVISNCNIADPVSIFKSQKQFEMVIRSVVDSIRLSGESNEPSTQHFLSRLFDYFKKSQMAADENKIRIANRNTSGDGYD